MLTVVIVLALVSFMSLSFSVSYSFMTRSKISGNTAQLTTTNMNYTVTYTNLVNQGMYFLSDEDGMNQNTYSTITINKPTGYDTYYYLYFCYSGNSVSVTNLPMEYVRYAIYSFDGSNNISSTPLAGPAPIADLHISASSKNYGTSYYIAYLGILNSTTTSTKLAIKLWGDLEAADVFEGNPTDFAVIVYQYPIKNTVFNNISGILYDTADNPIAGATISLNHGMITATTDSNGAYTLSNVPMGRWVLNVINGDTTYSTSLSTAIQTATYPTGSVQPYTASTTSNTSGSWLQTRAYARFTTVYQILKYPSNSLTNDSNHTASGTYTTPAGYVVYAADRFELTTIPNIKLKLAANNQVVISKAT